ncbi:MAG: hypothetical protein CMD06_03845 [Flavobacteriales bacterium]|nr:hypothetical protein [Flavobacteriales bacterium]
MLSVRQKKISLSIFFIMIAAVMLGSYNSIVTLWKSAYIEEGQTISAYNSIELDILSSIESSYKSILPPTETDIEKVYLYISQKNQNHLLSGLPYSTKEWVGGLILDGSELKKISVRHRGDNPNNWLHKKKSWRVKRKKSDLKDGMRVFNYLLPRDTALINTYLGYYIAESMNIPFPRYKYVELFINDKYQGLYLETEHIDENFLRMSDIMPVNIYKGTPSRTDKPINLDSDLFNNPFLWEKRAIFNARPSTNYDDLQKLMSFVRSSANDANNMNLLEKLVDVKKWAKFSAYETLMQSWHNYEKNNMYLISDPWMEEIYPIAFDTIFNDTKSRLIVDEQINMDNAAHALMEVLSNNPRFLYEKYRILDQLITSGFYEDIKKEAKSIYKSIRSSWSKDPSHVQFTLTNEFDRKLFLTKGMDKEFELFIKRIDYIEKGLIDNLSNRKTSSWFQDRSRLHINIDSYKPVTAIKICSESTNKSIGIQIFDNKNNKFLGHINSEGCHEYDIILNSNRTKPQGNKSRITTFSASNGFEIKPTRFIFDIDSEIQINRLYTKFLGEDEFIHSENDEIEGHTRALNNAPYRLDETESTIVWEGDIFVDEILIINQPLKIMPGTNIFLSKNASIIFKNHVDSSGEEYSRINFLRSDLEPWGIIALIGENTSGSVFKFTNFNGGSGGNHDGYFFTGMFSIHSSNNIQLSGLEFSDNSDYDDLIHILYSKNIRLSDSYIFDGRADLIDIDISEMEINNCIFENSGNDAIDAMTSDVIISNTFIRKSGDKGLSAGESSKVFVTNLTFENTQIAIQSKDGTMVSVKDSKFLNNSQQLDAYQKNWRYGDGGRINVESSSFEGIQNSITARSKSKITISNSFFNKKYSHLKNKRVNFTNNTIRN